MAISYGFYNSLYNSSTGYDRYYQSGEMSKLFDGIIIDGVYLATKDDDPTKERFAVSAYTENMNITVAPGRAWFLGTYTVSSSPITLAIDPADQSNPRIDAVVIEINNPAPEDMHYDEGPVFTERYNDIKIVKGTAAVTPSKPQMVHEDGIDQFPIAYITVEAGTTAIRPYNIEYVVGTDTPYFAWVGERLSVTELYSKWESDLGLVTMPFISWFNAMQDMLGNGDEDYENIMDKLDDVSENDYVKGIVPRVNEEVQKFNGDGSTKTFTLTPSSDVVISSIADILVDGQMVYNYTFDSETNIVTLESAPASGTDNVEIYYVRKADSYTLYFEEVSNV